MDEPITEVRGIVFSSDELSAFWTTFDNFEGDGYQRVKTSAQLEDDEWVETYIYVIKRQ